MDVAISASEKKPLLFFNLNSTGVSIVLVFFPISISFDWDSDSDFVFWLEPLIKVCSEIFTRFDETGGLLGRCRLF